MSQIIQIKYHDTFPGEPLEKPKMLDQGDWIDLRAAEEVSLKTGEFKLISLGVSMKLPDGYEAHIAPRGSTFLKHGIIQANHLGIVDNSYSGDNDIWYFPAIALRDTYIPKNTRICQFRIVKKMPPVVFVEIDRLEGPDRGAFGSTGEK